MDSVASCMPPKLRGGMALKLEGLMEVYEVHGLQGSGFGGCKGVPGFQGCRMIRML